MLPYSAPANTPASCRCAEAISPGARTPSPVLSVGASLSSQFSWSSLLSWLFESVVQLTIELRPHVVLLGACYMAERAFRLRLHLGRRCLRLAVIEVVVSPSIGFCVSLGVLDGHVGAVHGAGEIASPRRLLHGLIREPLGPEDSLQFLEEDRAFRKLAGLLVDVIGSRFDVDVVVFGKPRLAAVQRVGRQR